MRPVHVPLSVILGAMLLVAGCAGAPESSTAPTKPTTATPPAPPPRPQATPATPSRPQQNEPPPAIDEGMTSFELQERLNQLGYKVGTVDGVIGPRTTEALRKFQSDNNLSATGTLDAQTIKKLRTAKY
jgi:peptidoglycan hydrolase-like protein with peptidoglycan-binding domain